jgi:hypothetical protein
MRKSLLLSVLCLVSSVVHAQSPKLFTPQQLKQDLQVLKDSLIIVHPALYRYVERPVFNAAFLAVERKLNKPLSLNAFYTLVAPLATMAGDIHTLIELPDEYRNEVAVNNQLFPFDVRIIGQEVFIASNNSDDSTISVGSRITKINDQPILKVLQKMGSTFSGEGANQSYKTRLTEQRFAFHYFFVYGDCKTFKIEFLDGDSRKEKTVAPQPFSVISERRADTRKVYPLLKPLYPQPPYLSLSLEKEKRTAVLTVKWLQNDVLAGNGEAFKPFIDSAFAVIKKESIQHLVIDVRNNDGGESANASYLYSYLSSNPFRFLYAMEAGKQAYETDAAIGIRYTKTGGLYRTTDSTSTIGTFFGLNTQSLPDNRFSGAVYVLADGLTVSAAAQFVTLVKLNNRGMLIGEEIPGAINGGSGRGYAYFNLPNTNLVTMISRYRLYMTDPKKPFKEGCVMPDHRSQKSIAEILNGVDKDLQAASDLIQKAL